MRLATDAAEVIARIERWGTGQDAVRLAVLTSSRANPRATVDLLTDYDVAHFVSDPDRFAQHEPWVHGFGTPLLRVRDAVEVSGHRVLNDMVLYDDGTKIDFSIWPLALAERIGTVGAVPEDFDSGYRVLLDKDSLTTRWPAPTHRAYIPKRPSAAEFQSLVEEFWFVTTYVAKNLWRDEFLTARVIFDQELKYLVLRRFLEWRLEIDHDWSVQPGFFGRGLARYLDPDIWDALQETYAGPGHDETWLALERTIELFRHIATSIARDLGYHYPHDLHRQMSEYLHQIRQTGIRHTIS